MVDEILWGKDKGCDFFENVCSSTSATYTEFLEAETYECTYDG